MVSDDNIYNVLFLCTRNSAHSIIAEAILQREGLSEFNAFSAGSKPIGQLNPHAVELLRNLNYETNQYRSKNRRVFAGPEALTMDFVFTVCDNALNEVCPVWLGQPLSAHWGIPDPASVGGTMAEIAAAFADTYRMLANRISIFVSLAIESLEQLTLQKQLDDIGNSS